MTDAQDMPVYNSRETVRALKVSRASPTSTVFGAPWQLIFQQIGQPNMEVSHAFMQVYQPKSGGYYVQKNDSPPFYMQEDEFEKLYVKA